MIDLDNEARRLISITVEEHERLLAIERRFLDLMAALTGVGL